MISTAVATIGSSMDTELLSVKAKSFHVSSMNTKLFTELLHNYQELNQSIWGRWLTLPFLSQNLKTLLDTNIEGLLTDRDRLFKITEHFMRSSMGYSGAENFNQAGFMKCFNILYYDKLLEGEEGVEVFHALLARESLGRVFSDAFWELKQAKLFNRENVLVLLQHGRIVPLVRALEILNRDELLTQQHFELIVNSNIAWEPAHILCLCKEIGLPVDTKDIAKHSPDYGPLRELLLRMQNLGLLTLDNVDSLFDLLQAQDGKRFHFVANVLCKAGVFTKEQELSLNQSRWGLLLNHGVFLLHKEIPWEKITTLTGTQFEKMVQSADLEALKCYVNTHVLKVEEQVRVQEIAAGSSLSIRKNNGIMKKEASKVSDDDPLVEKGEGKRAQTYLIASSSSLERMTRSKAKRALEDTSSAAVTEQAGRNKNQPR